MTAWFFAAAGAIIVGLAYFSKRSFHKSMERQRADEAVLERKLAEFWARTRPRSTNSKNPNRGSEEDDDGNEIGD